MQMRNFRLRRASSADAGWVCDLMSQFGTQAQLEENGIRLACET
jgi:hypothetical protein